LQSGVLFVDCFGQAIYEPDLIQPTLKESLQDLEKLEPLLESVSLYEIDEEGTEEPSVGNPGKPHLSTSALDKLVEQSITRVGKLF
jgi:hypothetical protein